MNKVLCIEHNKPCMLKTGVKEGASKGKSFYICSHTEARCDFVDEAKVRPMQCLKHSDHVVELQALHISKASSEERHYYRCTEGRREKKNWCGFILDTNPPQKQPLKSLDKNVAHDIKKASDPKGLLKNDTGIKPIRKTSPESEQKPTKPPQNVPEKRNNSTGSQKAGKISPISPQDIKIYEDNPAPTTVITLKQQTGKDKSAEKSTKKRSVDSSKPAQVNKVSPTSEVKQQESRVTKLSLANSKAQQSISKNLDSTDRSTKAANTDKSQKNGTNKPVAHKTVSDIRNDSYRNSTSHADLSSDSEEYESCDEEANDDSDDDCVITSIDHSGTSINQSGTSINRSGTSLNRSDTGANQSGTDSVNLISDRMSVTSVSDPPGDSHSKNIEKVVSKPTVVADDDDDDCMIVDDTSNISSKGHGGAIPKISPMKEAQKPPVSLLTNRPATVQQNIQPASNVARVQQGTLPPGTRVIKVNKNDHESLMQDMNKKQQLEKHLERQKKLMSTINLATLPDKGQKFRALVDSVTNEIEDITITIKEKQANMLKGGTVTVTTAGQTTTTLGGQVVATTNMAGQVLPGVKQTKITDHAFTSQISSHVYQQMFAANPHMQQLYGGRMTAARLREVGSVTNEAIERLFKQLETCPPPDRESEDPEGLNISLMRHQRHALSWLTWREHQHPPGGILADDMGLGKTLTMISLIIKQKKARLEAETSKGGDGEKKDVWMGRDKELKKFGDKIVKSTATLVICPASLVHQWNKEIERRCEKGLLNVIVYHGQNRETNINKLAAADVVLTTYGLVSREVGAPDIKKTAHDMPVQDDEDQDEGSVVGANSNLLRIAWERIILDEGHSIKNHKSLTSRSVTRLRALFRWVLTGTPIQNDLLDMYSLLRFLRCSPFDEYKVWKKQVDNQSAKGTRRLNTLVNSLLLRRTKDQTGTDGNKLVELPSKNFRQHELHLSKEEQQTYDKIFQQSRQTLQDYLKQTDDDSDTPHSPRNSNPWKGQSEGGHTPGGHSREEEGQKKLGKGQILLLLLRLRQCCGHLHLLKEALEEEGLKDDLELNLTEQMANMSIAQDLDLEEPSIKESPEVTDIACPSTKISAILEEIKKIRKDSKKEAPMKSVIVSQWTKMLDIVEFHLKDRGIKCDSIRGETPPKKRTELVEAFNNDPKGPQVMLVSLRAGGVGLNLIGGNHLFLVDMHWNPALEQQAFDRIYRLGQKRDVYIHRFVCKSTVEEKILALQEKKLSLAKNILTGAGASNNKLTLNDLRDLFDLHRPQPRPTHFNNATAGYY